MKTTERSKLKGKTNMLYKLLYFIVRKINYFNM